MYFKLTIFEEEATQLKRKIKKGSFIFPLDKFNLVSTQATCNNQVFIDL